MEKPDTECASDHRKQCLSCRDCDVQGQVLPSHQKSLLCKYIFLSYELVFKLFLYLRIMWCDVNRRIQNRIKSTYVDIGCISMSIRFSMYQVNVM